jgi:hypothetical protein
MQTSTDKQEMNFKKTTVYFTLTLLLCGHYCFGQTSSCEEVGKDLTKIYNKISPFYYGDNDSLSFYSDLFSTKLTNYIKSNPATLDCEFKSLTDSGTCSIVTSADGSFRIYSWDTWLGGTMRNYKNLFQFKSEGKVRTLTFDYGEGDMGTFFTDVFSLKANGKIYFLGVSGGSESTKIAYEIIRAYSISDSIIDDSVKLIKTASGLKNSILIEYDFFSVVDRPDRPIKLIKYDADKKIIYIPVVWENGKVTNKYIRYQFTGQYFEKLTN